MTASYSNRLTGIETSVALKAPVKAATTANITLSGPQTVDGVALMTGDRVLVKDQTTASENGVYVVGPAAWSRATDFDSSAEIVHGTIVYVQGGTTNAITMWVVTTAAPAIGSAMAFDRIAAVLTDESGNTTLSGDVFVSGGFFVANAAPALSLTDTDNNVDVRISTDAAGSVRLRADFNDEQAGSKIIFEIDDAVVGSVDEFGHLRLGDGTDPTVTAEFAGTDAILLPVGTTAQAPAATAGRIRYNSTLGAPTFANGSAHKVLSSGWELFETAYDFSVDGAVASVLANGWEDGWDYAVLCENLTFDGTTYPEVAFEFAGTTLTGYVTSAVAASGTASRFYFYSELHLARVARNVFGVRFISNRDDDGTYADSIASGVSTGAYIGINRATAQAMSGFAIRGNSLDDINGGTVKVYRKRNAL
jgi:hypothetical protein